MESPNIHLQLGIAAAVICAKTFVHGVFVAAAAAMFRATIARAEGAVRFFRDSLTLMLLGMWLMFAHALEMGIWAWTYLHFDMFDHWETALYFSGASFTTLGFGDVLLSDEWRLLSGATAANGLLLFGLSAAFLFDAAGQLHLGGKRR